MPDTTVEKSGSMIAEMVGHVLPEAQHAIHLAEGALVATGAAGAAGHMIRHAVSKLRRPKPVTDAPKAGGSVVYRNNQYKVAHSDSLGTLIHHVPSTGQARQKSVYMPHEEWQRHVAKGNLKPLQKSEAPPMPDNPRAYWDGLTAQVDELAKGLKDTMAYPLATNGAGKAAPHVDADMTATPAKTAKGKLAASGEAKMPPQSGKTSISGAGTNPGDAEAHKAVAAMPMVGTKTVPFERFWPEGYLQKGASGEITKVRNGRIVIKYPVINGKHVTMNVDESTWAALVHPFTAEGGMNKSEGDEAPEGTLEKAEGDVGHDAGDGGGKELCPDCKVAIVDGMCPKCKTKIAKSDGEAIPQGELVKSGEAPAVGYEPQIGDVATDHGLRQFEVKEITDKGLVRIDQLNRPTSPDLLMQKSEWFTFASMAGTIVTRDNQPVEVGNALAYRKVRQALARLQESRRPGEAVAAD